MKKIGVKLWLIFTSMVFLVLGLIWFFQIFFLENLYIDARLNSITKQMLNISKTTESTNLPNQLEKFAFNNNLTIELINKNHKTVFSTNTDSKNTVPMHQHSLKVDATNHALNGEIAIYTFIHPRFSTKFFLVGIPNYSSTDNTSIIMLTIPIAPVEETTGILKQQLFYISAILLLAALPIAYFLSRSLTNPILKINYIAEQIANGNFSSKLKVNRKDELGTLMQTINNMSFQLEKIENLRKELISNVSHELRTPLALIQGYAETIRDVTWQNDEKRTNSLNIIVDESKRLASIVSDILNLSILESENFELDMENIHLTNLLEDIVKKYTLLNEKLSISIILEISENLTVKGDRKRIEQVFYNLITNALNHTSPNGSITIKSILNESNVRIEISDTGKGIPEDQLDNIWKRFYKSGPLHNNSLPSSGLGLAIVKRIFIAHNSKFGVESQVGVGTTFWFTMELSN
jgi:signal transduction histidine kinase